jgi:hypothetical protein
MAKSARLLTLWICAVAAGITVPCFADDDAFVEVDPTTIVGKGEMLFQQWLGWTHGHCAQSFNGLQAVSEFDYGLTDRLQLAVSLEYDWERLRAPLRPAETSDYPALSAEAIYVLIPAEKGRFGLSVALAPSISRDDHGFEARVLMQRDVFGFHNVLNIGFENVWDRDAGHWVEGGGLSVNYGIAFPLTQHWTVSLEANNERGFDGLFPSVGIHQSSDTYFAGPTIQYDCDFAVFTLGAQAQLPLGGAGSDDADGYSPDVERFRMVARITKAV